MRADPNDWMIARATVDLGRNLGLQVVAEGVEDPDILVPLAEMGCELAQGYSLCVPLPATDMTAWLEARRPPAGTLVETVGS